MATRSKVALAAVSVALAVGLVFARSGEPYPATFSGGHDLGKEDHGRPCVLIAAALGVKAEVFREAFSGVTPATGRGPSGDEARQNKDALLRVLGSHGVSNDRLDEVSDHYRFKPQDGELWRHRPAKAHAVVVDGKITGMVVTDPGAGYTTPPRVTVKGFEEVEFAVTLRFDRELTVNGSIQSIVPRP